MHFSLYGLGTAGVGQRTCIVRLGLGMALCCYSVGHCAARFGHCTLHGHCIAGVGRCTWIVRLGLGIVHCMGIVLLGLGIVRAL